MASLGMLVGGNSRPLLAAFVPAVASESEHVKCAKM
jgi:hypothetical protein